MKFQFTCSVQRSQALQDHDQKHSRAVLLNSWQQLYLTKALKEWFPSVTPYGIKHETSQLTPRSGIFDHMSTGCFENLFGWFWFFFYLFKLWFIKIFHAKKNLYIPNHNKKAMPYIFGRNFSPAWRKTDTWNREKQPTHHDILTLTNLGEYLSTTAICS